MAVPPSQYNRKQACSERYCWRHWKKVNKLIQSSMFRRCLWCELEVFESAMHPNWYNPTEQTGSHWNGPPILQNNTLLNKMTFSLYTCQQYMRLSRAPSVPGSSRITLSMSIPKLSTCNRRKNLYRFCTLAHMNNCCNVSCCILTYRLREAPSQKEALECQHPESKNIGFKNHTALTHAYRPNQRHPKIHIYIDSKNN